jgi:hypothetical protein
MPECMNAGLLVWAGAVVDEDILMCCSVMEYDVVLEEGL